MRVSAQMPSQREWVLPQRQFLLPGPPTLAEQQRRALFGGARGVLHFDQIALEQVIEVCAFAEKITREFAAQIPFGDQRQFAQPFRWLPVRVHAALRIARVLVKWHAIKPAGQEFAQPGNLAAFPNQFVRRQHITASFRQTHLRGTG